MKPRHRFGVNVDVSGEMDGGAPTFNVPSSSYASPGSILVEGDASSASYFLAGAAITGGEVTVVGCGSKSVQGDVRFVDCLEEMGARVTWADDSITVTRDESTPLVGGEFDCLKIPDAAMTLAVVALFCEGSTTIRNVYSWRLKETERMKAIVAELTKLGAEVSASWGEGGATNEGPRKLLHIATREGVQQPNCHHSSPPPPPLF